IRDFHVTGVQTCALPISSRQEMACGTWGHQTAAGALKMENSRGNPKKKRPRHTVSSGSIIGFITVSTCPLQRLSTVLARSETIVGSSPRSQYAEDQASFR